MFQIASSDWLVLVFQAWELIQKIRAERLVEAVEVIRALWTGEVTSHHGRHFTVENARIYDAPADPIPVVVSAFGPKAAEVAAKEGDGIWMTSPRDDVLKAFAVAAGRGPHHLGLVHAALGEPLQQGHAGRPTGRVDRRHRLGHVQRADRLGHLGHDRCATGTGAAAFACGDVLVHLKAENGHLPKRADWLAVQLSTVGLGTVFQHGYSMFGGNSHDFRHGGWNATHVYRENQPGLRRNLGG